MRHGINRRTESTTSRYNRTMPLMRLPFRLTLLALWLGLTMAAGPLGCSNKGKMQRVGKADPRLVKQLQDAEARRQARNGQ